MVTSPMESGSESRQTVSGNHGTKSREPLQGSSLAGNQQATPGNQVGNYREAWNQLQVTKVQQTRTQLCGTRTQLQGTMEQLPETRIYLQGLMMFPQLLQWRQGLFFNTHVACLAIAKTRTINKHPLGTQAGCYSEDRDHSTIPLGPDIGMADSHCPLTWVAYDREGRPVQCKSS